MRKEPLSPIANPRHQLRRSRASGKSRGEALVGGTGTQSIAGTRERLDQKRVGVFAESCWNPERDGLFQRLGSKGRHLERPQLDSAGGERRQRRSGVLRMLADDVLQGIERLGGMPRE